MKIHRIDKVLIPLTIAIILWASSVVYADLTATEGLAIDLSSAGAGTDMTIAFDATELDAVTWSDNANASNIWTFDVSGTDHTMTAGNGLMTFSHALTIGGTATANEFSGGGAGLTAVDAATGDSATAFFDAGTIEHEWGGLQADVSAYTGLIGITGADTTVEVDTFAELDTAIADKALVNKADGAVWSGVHDFGGATSTEITNDEAADGTLTALGQVHIRGDEDRFSAHLGAGGEIAGEGTKSFLYHLAQTFDPGSWYDSDTEVFCFTVDAKDFPNGIIIDQWKVSCNVDPDVEMDLDLKRADAWIGLANAAVMDVLDTTNGVSSEDTDANINGGAAVAVTKVVYLSFGADPEGTATQMIFEMWFHAEED